MADLDDLEVSPLPAFGHDRDFFGVIGQPH
jgi:hypothetical protein